ncbi:hypothetical protein [Marivita sp. S2033]|uniref:hypothetical protein n=1 Tax=Marivita sp. S2033 TaxID=3373187 RepID=UPI003982658A
MFPQRSSNERIEKYTGPYERWVFSEDLGRPYAFPAIKHGPSTHFTALMEGRGTLHDTANLKIRIPPLWSSSPDVTPFVMWDKSGPTESANEDARLARLLDTLDAPRYRLNMPIEPATWATTYTPDQPPAGWRRPSAKPRAIIGVIDDGIPFMHRAFCDSQGATRINVCWMQGARADTRAAVPMGREITNGQIDDLRARHGSQERRAYFEAGAIDRHLPELDTVLMHHATHGAHIMGLAAGNDRTVSAHDLPDDAQIIAVQLPNTIAWDTSGFGKEMMMLSAIEYIFQRARMIADAYDGEEIPLVLNFSYGWSANRHDGQSSFERAVEAILTSRRERQPLTEIVMPTGNNFANDMHARLSPDDATDGVYNFGWQIKPDDRTSSYLEIWLPLHLDPRGWSVTVTPPHNLTLETGGTMDISPDADLAGGDPRRFGELEMMGKNIGQLSVDRHQGNRWRVMLALIPTTANNEQDRRAPSGLWTISVDTAQDPLREGQHLDIWVQRDDDPTQLGTGGQQSVLVDLKRPKPPRPLETRGLSPVRGYGCLNGIGTAPSVFRVAGYVQTTDTPAPYSGSASVAIAPDETATLGPEVPNACAVSDQGTMRPGLPSIGVLSGSGARVIGTSAAAATATRMIALNFLSGNGATTGFLPLHDDTQPKPMQEAQAIAREGKFRVPPVCGIALKHPG